MKFNEWLDQFEGFHLVRENFTPEQVLMIEIGWNAAIGEAAVVGGHACESCRIPDGQKVADKIKELRTYGVGQ